MGYGRWSGVIALLAAASAARADPTQLVAVASPSTSRSSPTLGVMTGVGLPDGATASLAWRPIRALRIEAGAAHNYVSPGVRGGVTYIPFGTWATPTLGVGAGHFFERDANPAVRTISGDSTFDSPMLDRVGYDYADARVGIELGRKHVTFFLHVGITRLTAQIHDVAAAAAASMQPGTSMVTITSTDPNITLWAPSLDLGIVVYLF